MRLQQVSSSHITNSGGGISGATEEKVAKGVSGWRATEGEVACGGERRWKVKVFIAPDTVGPRIGGHATG